MTTATREARRAAEPCPYCGADDDGDERHPTRREVMAERLACRLDAPFTLAGLLLVLVVVAENMTPAASPLRIVWAAAGWLLWGLFVLELLLRLVMAPSAARFLRRNWWQVAFLAVPFLRFLRSLSRTARLARLASTSVRGTRTAGRNLAGRVGWVLGATVSVVLASSELLFEYGPAGTTYPAALHDVLLAAVSSQQLPQPGAVADVLEIFLALWASVVFATLAGVAGAYFLETSNARRA